MDAKKYWITFAKERKKERKKGRKKKRKKERVRKAIYKNLYMCSMHEFEKLTKQKGKRLNRFKDKSTPNNKPELSAT